MFFFFVSACSIFCICFCLHFQMFLVLSKLSGVFLLSFLKGKKLIFFSFELEICLRMFFSKSVLYQFFSVLSKFFNILKIS